MLYDQPGRLLYPPRSSTYLILFLVTTLQTFLYPILFIPESWSTLLQSRPTVFFTLTFTIQTSLSFIFAGRAETNTPNQLQQTKPL